MAKQPIKPEETDEQLLEANPVSDPVPADSALLSRRVLVTIGYRGRATNEQFIEPGEYDENAVALYGLADFLVGTGRAVYL